MPRIPHVRLVIATKAHPDTLLRAVQSARHLIDSACIAIPRKGYDHLPHMGFGFMCLETEVVQFDDVDSVDAHTKLLRYAEADERVDWVLAMSPEDVIRPDTKLPLFDGSTDAYPLACESPLWVACLIRARRGLSWLKPVAR